MVYRDAAGDLRTAELRSLVGAEQTLQDAARRLRFEQDDANDEVDRLGRELAGAERDVERARVGGLRSWFGRGRTASEGAVHILRDALEHAMARLDELVAQEGMVRAQLEAIAAARVELAAREARAGDLLRASDSPAGADYRALDTAIAREIARLAALEVVLRKVELADVAIAAVVQVDRDVTAQADAPGSVGRRAEEAVLFAKGQLHGVVDELARVAAIAPALLARLPQRDVATYVASSLGPGVERSPLVTRAWCIARELSTMLTEVAAERDRVRARQAELEERQRDAAARYLGGSVPSSEVA